MAGTTTEVVPVVVVGVDGSRNSKAALRWAVRYAQRTGAELHAVIAFGYLMPGFGFAPVGHEQLEKEARWTLDHTIEDVVGRNEPVPIVREVVASHPIPALVAASRSAETLVVGDRGYGGFAGLLLGSVGEQCVRRATCTVVVVRDHRR
jgi:nucleotide-binding universal stress UspA family protein